MGYDTLGRYAELLKRERQLITSCLGNKNEIEVRQLSCDSKKVEPGTLFICKGAAFKAEYLQEALKQGACGYVSEQEYDVDGEVPHIIVKSMRKVMPLLAKAFCEDADEYLKLVGVTGTKGKTTTSYYVKAILDEYLKVQQGQPSGLISSIETYDGKSVEESMLTTPEPLDLFKHLKNAKDTDIEYVTMEVSSQGLKYHRVRKLQFEVGVFLNIAEDHISPIEHENFEDYFSAKLSIFKQTKTACVNMDSEHAARILKAARLAERIVTFGTKGNPDILGYNIRTKRGHLCFSVRCKEFRGDFILAMRGRFNIENALAAIAVAYTLGIPKEYMVLGLAKAKVDGRMEQYESSDGKVTAIVDFAHNKLSFEKLFDSVMLEYPKHKVTTIFGCPGNKAYNRRKELGLLAGLYSGKLYLVPDDPGTERPEAIAAEIGEYAETVGCPYEYMEDRGAAIMQAIEAVDEKTIILVLGKGNERRQKYGKEIYKCPSDGEYVQEGLKKYERDHFSIGVTKTQGAFGAGGNTVLSASQ